MVVGHHFEVMLLTLDFFVWCLLRWRTPTPAGVLLSINLKLEPKWDVTWLTAGFCNAFRSVNQKTGLCGNLQQLKINLSGAAAIKKIEVNQGKSENKMTQMCRVINSEKCFTRGIWYQFYTGHHEVRDKQKFKIYIFWSVLKEERGWRDLRNFGVWSLEASGEDGGGIEVNGIGKWPEWEERLFMRAQGLQEQDHRGMWKQGCCFESWGLMLHGTM